MPDSRESRSLRTKPKYLPPACREAYFGTVFPSLSLLFQPSQPLLSCLDTQANINYPNQHVSFDSPGVQLAAPGMCLHCDNGLSFPGVMLYISPNRISICTIRDERRRFPQWVNKPSEHFLPSAMTINTVFSSSNYCCTCNITLAARSQPYRTSPFCR